MVLTGNYGNELMSIHCNAINVDVVVTNDGGEQVAGRVGKAVEVKPGFIEFAPDDCPLTIGAEIRELGSFAACKACPHAILESEGMTEI